MAFYDASQEHKPFERKDNPSGRHPRPRIGATAKRNARRANRREEVQAQPVKKKK